MKNSKLWALILAIFWIAALADNLQAATLYRYYTTGQGDGSMAMAVNEHNQVVVNFNDRAFLWTLKDGLTDLGHLGGGKSYGYATNNQGQIVGESYINNTTSHAFLWQNGQIHDLGALSSGVRNLAISINNLGQVIGASLNSNNSISMFQWTQGDLQPLDLQGGFARKIIDDGRMVGSKNNHAWLWTAPGAGQDLGTLPAPYNGNAEAYDINKNGQVVGCAMQLNPPADNASHALSWTQSGGLQDLGTVGNIPGISRALAINNQGYIVGWSDYTTPDGTRTSGCLWTPAGDKFSLDTLVINHPGERIGDGIDINDKGIIVGQGNGGGAAYMLVPQMANLSPGVLLLLLQ